MSLEMLIKQYVYVGKAISWNIVVPKIHLHQLPGLFESNLFLFFTRCETKLQYVFNRKSFVTAKRTLHGNEEKLERLSLRL